MRSTATRLSCHRLLLVGHIEAMGVGYVLPDGRTLFSDVSFRVGDGAVVALVTWAGHAPASGPWSAPGWSSTD